MNHNLLLGECLAEMKKISDNSIDSIVTDAPYGLSFMNKKWDHEVPSIDIWKECFRVLKPGGHLLCFAGTRTQHRMATNIEDAGFEIKDMIAWVYAQGFPKSLNISKAIDRAAGEEREVIGQNEEILKKQKKDFEVGKRKIVDTLDRGAPERNNGFKKLSADITLPATEDAKTWDGFGTALKPAMEPITVARKPISEKTISENVLKWGTGAINIDGCRINYTEDNPPIPQLANDKRNINSSKSMYGGNSLFESKTKSTIGGNLAGRFPSNFIHDGSEEVVSAFPDAPGQQGDLINHKKDIVSPNGIFGKMAPRYDALKRNETNKSASRFFFSAKVSKKERGEGNTHPTVKPIELMKYLCKLVTPPGGKVLDPFMGSGSTGPAALHEGFSFIGIERDESYWKIAKKRISNIKIAKKLF